MKKTMLRKTIPVRNCTKHFERYQSYKEYLQKDFNERCGYCDISEELLGTPFHIDHFAPKNRFQELETNYSNLVYACPSCNRAKWNHWPMPSATPTHDGKRGYIDPCTKEYDEHLERKTDGSIRGKSLLGIYIQRKLKLHLQKHRIFWLFDKLIQQTEKIDTFLETKNWENDEILALKEKRKKLVEYYYSYHRLIRKKRYERKK